MAERSSRLRFIVDSSDAKTAARDFDRLGDEAAEAGRKTDRLANSSEKTARAVSGMGRAVKGLIAALAVREILQFADAFQSAQNRLRLVTDSTEELIAVQEKLQAIAGRTFSTFSGTADLYSRLARSTQELGVSSNRLLAITETVNKAVAISGTSAQAAQAALFQLGQGLSAGALRGEELNSVLEQTPELANAIAAGLGVSIGELRKLGAEGAITAEKVITALEDQADAVNESFEKLQPTIGQVATVINEAFRNAFVEEFIESLGEAGVSTLELKDSFAALGEFLGRFFVFALERFNDLIDATQLLGRELKRFGLIKIDFDVNFESVKEVRALLEDVTLRANSLEERLRDSRPGDGARFNTIPEGDPRREAAIAELAALKETAAELTAILTNQVSPASSDLFQSLADLNDAVGKPIDSVTDLGDAAREAAERLKDLQTAGNRRGDFASGLGSGATTLSEFDRQIAPLFSDEAAEQLAKDIGVSVIDAQRQLNEEESRLRKEFLDNQEDIARDAARDVSKNIEDGAREGVIAGLENGLDGLNLAGEFAEIGEQLFDNLSRTLNDFRNSTGGLFEKVAIAVGGIGKSFGKGLEDLGGVLKGGFGDLLGQIGGALGAAGQVATFALSAVSFLKDLLQGGSALTFDLSTGAESFKNKGKNLPEVRELGSQTVSIAKDLADLLGAEINNQLGIRFRVDGNSILPSVRNLSNNSVVALAPGSTGVNDTVTEDPEEAIAIALKLIVDHVLVGADTAFSGFASRLLASGKPVEDALNEISQVRGVIDAAEKLGDSVRGIAENFIDAALAADLSGQQITEAFNNLSVVLRLADEPLSDVGKALKNIDDAVKPVVDQLSALGQSIEQIEQIAADATRALGESFIRDIQQEILSFRNATLGEFKAILDAQEQLVSDARTLLERGAITPAEFDLVQVRNALERESFFEGLSPEDLEGLGDFFGLIETSGGSVAVVLTQLTDAFSDFTDGVSGTRDRLQREADQLKGYADQIFSTRDSIDLRFPSLSGGELLGDLRGQLSNLREKALAGDNTAFEQIPDLANRLVNVAREIFGGTSDFAQERDFALNVLDQTGALAESRANKLLSEIEALNTQVDVLNEIRDALESPDPALEFLQAQLNQGEIQNDLIRQLLTQYIALTAEARAGQLSPGEAQAASEGFLSSGGSAQSNVVSIDRFDENIVLLAQIRNELSSMRQQTTSILTTINDEQRRSTTNATLAG